MRSTFGAAAALLFTFASACTYDETLGRTLPPLATGHLQARWAIALGGPYSTSTQIARAPNGDVIAAGLVSQTEAPSDAFIARRAAADGASLWATTITGIQILDLGVDSEGNTVVVGSTNDGSGRTLLAKFSPAGALLWRHDLANWSGIAIAGLAIAPDGAMYVAGTYRGSIDLGAGVLTTTETPIPSDVRLESSGEAFLARFDANGVLQWGRTFGGSGGQQIGNLAVTSNGDVALTGFTFFGAAAFGGDEVQPAAGLVFGQAISRFSSLGECQWSQTLTPDANEGSNVATFGIDTLDRVIASGQVWQLNGPVLRTSTRVIETDGTMETFVGADTSWSGGVVTSDGKLVLIADNGNGGAAIRIDDHAGRELGATTITALGAPQVYSPFQLVALTATDDEVLVGGQLSFGADFGTGTIWSQHATTHPDGSPMSAGQDALVVAFDWIADPVN